MNKDIIKKHLIVLKEESEAPGLTKTKKIRDESGKTNKAANKDVAKQMKDYDKPLKDDSKPVKNEYTSKEKEYHDQMEIMNGQEMAEYGNEPSEIFKKRAEEAIAGSARMGNSPDYANVVTADQAGFTGEKFGENLVKTIKASKKKRDDAETVRGPKTTVSGADIKDSSMSNEDSKSIALSENKINKKSKMKRLVFKKEFKGIENALNVIPESYKVNGKQFHMTDGNEKYEIKWEGSLTEGRAVVLKASDKNLMSEDMQKMKHLMGYSSKETLGTVKGSARLDENARFNDVLNKTKNLLSEGPVAGGMQGFKSSWDDIVTNPDKDGRFDDYDDGENKYYDDNVSFPDAHQAPNSLRNPKRGEYDDRELEDIDPNLEFPGDLDLDEAKKKSKKPKMALPSEDDMAFIKSVIASLPNNFLKRVTAVATKYGMDPSDMLDDMLDTIMNDGETSVESQEEHDRFNQLITDYYDYFSIVMGKKFPEWTN